MAQGPISWALSVAALVAAGSVYYSERLAEAVGAQESGRAAAVSPAASPRPAEGRGTLSVAADARGHFLVHPTIDNFRIRMLVDTGASLVALTATDARALGLPIGPGDYRMTLNTANGTVKGARVTLREIRLGDIVVRNVDAVVLPAGALSTSLLGTSFLGRLQGYEVQTGRMVLRG